MTEITRTCELRLTHYNNMSELVYRHDTSIPPIVELFHNLATITQMGDHVELKLHQNIPGFPNGCDMYVFSETTYVEVAELLLAVCRLHLMWQNVGVKIDWSIEFQAKEE